MLEKGDGEYKHVKRFRVVPKHDKFKWNLPEHLAKYTNKHRNKFIPENDLQVSILVDNPVSLKLLLPRKME